MDSPSLSKGPASAFAFSSPAFVLQQQQVPISRLDHHPRSVRFQKQHEEEEDEEEEEDVVPKRLSLGDTADGRHQANTSINIFRSFIHRLSNGELDATGVTSEKCYDLWLHSRKSKPSCPEKAFQRALSGHITGVDGRVPFDQEEEEAILRAVRRKARWECFRHCDIKFGESGFRTKGFHEKAYAGEILKTQPKKRAKRAIEKIRNISRSLEAAQHQQQQRLRHDDDDGEEDDEASSSNESSATSPSSSSQSSHHHKRKRATGKAAVPSYRAAKSSSSSSAAAAVAPPPPLSRYPLRSASAATEPPMDRERASSSSSTDSSIVFYPHTVYESSASALSMKIPSVVTQPISAAASTLLGMLVNMALSLGALGLPYTTVVLGLHRTIQYSRGWFTSPRIDQAEELMTRLKQQYPTDYIMLCDFSQDPLNRYLVQNHLARKLFGKITARDGGCKGVRIPPTELWNVLKTYSEAAMLPSCQETRGEIQLYVRSQVRLCEVFISMDDATHIVIERGRVLGPVETDAVAPAAAVPSATAAASAGRLNLAMDITRSS